MRILRGCMISGKPVHVSVRNFLICKMGSLMLSEGCWEDEVG